MKAVEISCKRDVKNRIKILKKAKAQHIKTARYFIKYGNLELAIHRLMWAMTVESFMDGLERNDKMSNKDIKNGVIYD